MIPFPGTGFSETRNYIKCQAWSNFVQAGVELGSILLFLRVTNLKQKSSMKVVLLGNPMILFFSVIPEATKQTNKQSLFLL